MNYGAIQGTNDDEYEFDLDAFSPPPRKTGGSAATVRMTKASLLAQARSRAHSKPPPRSETEDSDSFSSSLDLTDSLGSPQPVASGALSGGIGSRTVYEAAGAGEDGDSSDQSAGAQSITITSALGQNGTAGGRMTNALGGSGSGSDLEFEDSREVSFTAAAAGAPLPAPQEQDDIEELEFGESEEIEDSASLGASLDIVDSPESVRSAQGAGTAHSSAFVQGQRVLAQWGGVSGDGQWFPGMVQGVHASGHYGIRYDDGDFEEFVPEHLVRPAAAPRRATVPFAVDSPAITTAPLSHVPPQIPSPVPSVPSAPSERHSASTSEYGDEQFEATGGTASVFAQHLPERSIQYAQAVHESYSGDSYSEFGSSHAPSSGPQQHQAADAAHEASDTAYTISFEDAPPSARSAVSSPATQQPRAAATAPPRQGRAVAWEQSSPRQGRAVAWEQSSTREPARTVAEDAPPHAAQATSPSLSTHASTQPRQSASTAAPGAAAQPHGGRGTGGAPPAPPQHAGPTTQGWSAAPPMPPSNMWPGTAHAPAMPQAAHTMGVGAGHPAPPSSAWGWPSPLFQPLQVQPLSSPYGNPLASAVYLQHLSASLLGPVSGGGAAAGALQGIQDSLARYRGSLQRSEDAFAKQLGMLRQQLAAVNSIRRMRHAGSGSKPPLQADGEVQTTPSTHLATAQSQMPDTISPSNSLTHSAVLSPASRTAEVPRVLPAPSGVDHSLPPSMQGRPARSAFAALRPENQTAAAGAKDWADRGRQPSLLSR